MQTTLSDIIDNVLLYAEDEDHYLHGKSRTLFQKYAKRLVQEINYAGVKSVKTLRAEFSPANYIDLPDDYVEYTRVFYVIDGLLFPAFHNTMLDLKDSTEVEGVFGFGGARVTENGLEGVPQYPHPHHPQHKPDPHHRACPYGEGKEDHFMRKGHHPHHEHFNEAVMKHTMSPFDIREHTHSFARGYRFDTAHNRMFFDYIPRGITEVVIEYISDPLAGHTDCSDIFVSKLFEKAIEAGIYYRMVENLRNVPMQEKVRAKREWSIKYRDAVREATAKPEELLQALLWGRYSKHPHSRQSENVVHSTPFHTKRGDASERVYGYIRGEEDVWLEDDTEDEGEE